jgi:integrase
MPTLRKRGSSWQVQVRRRGHQPINRSFQSRTDAEVWARSVEGRIDRDDLPRNHRDLRLMRLADLLSRYRDVVTPKKRSHQKEACRLSRLLNEPMALLTLDRVTPAILASFRDKRLSAAGHQAVRHDLNLLSHVFKIAINEWDVPLIRNPMSGVGKPSQPRARDRRLNDDELPRLEAAARSFHCDKARAIIMFAIESGMRKAEILSLRWAHIDLQRKLLQIPETKNGYPRTIPLGPGAAQIIEQARGNSSERVFPVSTAWLRYAWDQITSSAGITDLHFHDLRHEAISRFFEKGLSIPEVALISGHRDVRQLFRYTHLRAEDVAKKLG